jgi:hypothetical protein
MHPDQKAGMPEESIEQALSQMAKVVRPATYQHVYKFREVYVDKPIEETLMR